MTTARLIRPYDLLLDAATGWRRLGPNDISTDEGRMLNEISIDSGRIQLRTLEALTPTLEEPNGTFGGHALPRGVAIWGDEIFISDTLRHRILHWSPCCGEARPLSTVGGYIDDPNGGIAPAGEGQRHLDTPLGLAISQRNDLVVADSGNHRVLLLALPELALRRIIGPLPTPGESDPQVEAQAPVWRPVDVAYGPGGFLYVADANGLIWRLDSQYRPDPVYSGRLPGGTIPRRVLVDAQSRAYVVGETLDGQGGIFILDQQGHMMPPKDQLKAAVDRWWSLHIPPIVADPNVKGTFEEEREARANLLPTEFSKLLDQELTGLKRRMDDLVTEELRLNRLLDRAEVLASVWETQRDDAYGVVLATAYEDLLPQFLRGVLDPTRLSLDGDDLRLLMEGCRSGADDSQATGLTVDLEGRLVLDGEPGGPFMIHHPPLATHSAQGLYRTVALDSGDVGNPWHRVVLEIEAPERTAVRLFSFTSDVLRPDLTGKGLTDEPPSLDNWERAPDNTEEWLIQSPPGRYLYLALAMKGSGERTPTVSRIFVYMRRQSSLSYLPAVYQSEETSRHMLDRLLSMTDTIFGEIESQIEDFHSILDVDGTPADFLPWLASWFDLSLEQSWSEEQRRSIMNEIIKLYERRGTIRGLRRLLQLHSNLLEPMPQIIEHHRGEEMGWDESDGQAVSGAVQRWLNQPPQGDPFHHFTVVLPGPAMDSEEKRAVLERLIDANKPAHTRYTLRPLYPGVRLGSESVCGTALGVDSLLGDYASWRLPSGDDKNGFLAGIKVLPSAPTAKAAIKLGRTRLGAPTLGCRTCQPCEEA